MGLAWLGGNERLSESGTDGGHLVAWIMYSEIKEFTGNGSCNRRRVRQPGEQGQRLVVFEAGASQKGSTSPFVLNQGTKDLDSQLGDEMCRYNLPPRGYPSSKFLKARAMVLSGALSCFEEVCALALAFVFFLRKEK